MISCTYCKETFQSINESVLHCVKNHDEDASIVYDELVFTDNGWKILSKARKFETKKYHAVILQHAEDVCVDRQWEIRFKKTKKPQYQSFDKSTQTESDGLPIINRLMLDLPYTIVHHVFFFHVYM